MGLAGYGIDHGFGIAVVGRDDPCPTARPQRRKEAAQALVHGFDGFDGRFELPRMADHVGIREVHDDGVEIALLNRVNHGVGDAGGGHFRFQVVSRHLRRGHQDALLAGERLSTPPLKK